MGRACHERGNRTSGAWKGFFLALLFCLLMCAIATAESMDAWNLKVMGFDQLLEAAEAEESLQKPVLVAVIDTGCDVNHEVFRERISPDSRSFFGREDDLSNPDGHGTCVASVIAAATPPNVKLLILKVGENNQYASDSEFNDAILYALDHGADVINFCISIDIRLGEEIVRDWREGIRLCREKGVPFICGAGNHGQDAAYAYPASDPNAIAVSAVTAYGTLESHSNDGDAVEFSAPGEGVRTAKAGTEAGYQFSDGTSIAAPHLSAAAAYVKMVFPEYSWEQMKDALHACSVRTEEPAGRNAADMPVLCELIHGTAPTAGWPVFPALSLLNAKRSDNPKEGPENLFDGDPRTKWCIQFTEATAVEWKAVSPVAPTGILFGTGNDNSQHPGRNPEGMRLLGCNVPDFKWEVLWEQPPGENLPDEDMVFRAYEIPARDSAYRYFRLEIPASGGADVIQLSMIALEQEQP